MLLKNKMNSFIQDSRIRWFVFPEGGVVPGMCIPLSAIYTFKQHSRSTTYTSGSVGSPQEIIVSDIRGSLRFLSQYQHPTTSNCFYNSMRSGVVNYF